MLVRIEIGVSREIELVDELHRERARLQNLSLRLEVLATVADVCIDFFRRRDDHHTRAFAADRVNGRQKRLDVQIVLALKPAEFVVIKLAQLAGQPQS